MFYAKNVLHCTTLSDSLGKSSIIRLVSALHAAARNCSSLTMKESKTSLGLELFWPPPLLSCFLLLFALSFFNFHYLTLFSFSLFCISLSSICFPILFPRFSVPLFIPFQNLLFPFHPFRSPVLLFPSPFPFPFLLTHFPLNILFP